MKLHIEIEYMYHSVMHLSLVPTLFTHGGKVSHPWIERDFQTINLHYISLILNTQHCHYERLVRKEGQESSDMYHQQVLSLHYHCMEKLFICWFLINQIDTEFLFFLTCIGNFADLKVL